MNVVRIMGLKLYVGARGRGCQWGKLGPRVLEPIHYRQDEIL